MEGRRGGTAPPASRGAIVPPDHTLTSEPPDAEADAPIERRAGITGSRERYRVLGEHGRGGLGRVSRAYDAALGRDVAIKELISRGPMHEVRFLREALITARLEHPSIVPVHEAGRWPDGTPFYAMKLIAGRPLRELLNERKTAGERIGLLHHVIAVADAIAYAHGCNVIHRDLKPSNVIVGEFGETVVIDWGLAKDLTVSDDSLGGAGDSPSSLLQSDELTSAGTVLGTPAYMAPEQARGEFVDQRADVYAIGAMLWELCTPRRRRPANPRVRLRVLRRAGIDHDLIAIITKAIAEDPVDRYPDAGALASDLKAFKAGARIASRHYSLVAVLVHWIGHHRALAASILVAAALALAGTGVYVRRISAERNRADAALARVEAAQTALSAEHSELTLKHAELQLTSDPAAALDTLATYGGTSAVLAAQLKAEAIGRGAATRRAVPHTSRVLWLRGLPDHRIVSLGMDGTIAQTDPDGRSTVLIRGSASRDMQSFAYDAARHVLAYFCDPGVLCLFDLLRSAAIPVPAALAGEHLSGIDLSPDGMQVAIISTSGALRVVDLRDLAQPRERLRLETHDGGSVLFIDDDTIAVGTDRGVRLVHTDGAVQTLDDPSGTYWAVSPLDRRLVFATNRGEAYIAETRRLSIQQRAALCRGPISGMAVIPRSRAVAFACKGGMVGTWNPQDGAIRQIAHLEGSGDSTTVITAAESGEYVFASGDLGVVTAIDLRTQLTSTFRGHAFRITAMSPPNPEFPWLLSGDVRGAIRAWPVAPRIATTAGDTGGVVYSAVFDDRAHLVVAGTFDPSLITFSPERGVQFATPHTLSTPNLAVSPDGAHIAAYGYTSAVELWSAAPLVRERVFDAQHGQVSHAAFLSDTNDLVTGDRDGRLVAWSASGGRLLHHFGAPIRTFVAAPRTRALIVSTEDGFVWRVLGDRVELLRESAAAVTRMLVLPDGASVCIGYADGDAILIDTASWHEAVLVHARDEIRDIATTPDGHLIAIASNDGTLRIGARDEPSPSGVTWIESHVQARQIAFTRDGTLVAACLDGAVWIYRSQHPAWLYLPIATTELLAVTLSSDGKQATLFTADNHVVSLDLDAVRHHQST